MKKSSLYCALGLFILLSAGVYGCHKTNAINNNTVIETPYSLYFSDTAGTLYVTNDGKTIGPIVFPPDGKPCRSLITSGNIILWAKDNLYYSNNNGQNFNQSYDSLNASSNFNVGLTGSLASNGLSIDFNQSMLVTLPAWGGRDYTISWANKVGLTTNYLGIVHSDNNGIPGSWGLDGYDSISTSSTGVGRVPVRMTSFAQLANGTLCGLAYECAATPISAYANTNHIRYVRNFYVTSKDGLWEESTSNPDGVSTLPDGRGSNPLPPTVSVGPGRKTDTSFFTLGSYNNRLIAIDRKGEYGAWYSDDNGANWTKYSGLPANVPLLCISSPFGQVCLVGTEGGLYILNATTNTWQQNNSGLGSNLIIRNIAFKENVYTSGSVQQYIYLATNEGIYQSTNGGLSWVLTISGNYVDIY